jgi:hypothetical protein
MRLTERGHFIIAALTERGRPVVGSLTDTGRFIPPYVAPPLDADLIMPFVQTPIYRQ